MKKVEKTCPSYYSTQTLAQFSHGPTPASSLCPTGEPNLWCRAHKSLKGYILYLFIFSEKKVYNFPHDLLYSGNPWPNGKDP